VLATPSVAASCSSSARKPEEAEVARLDRELRELEDQAAGPARAEI
jgi:hypothetical protein